MVPCLFSRYRLRCYSTDIFCNFLALYSCVISRVRTLRTTVCPTTQTRTKMFSIRGINSAESYFRSASACLARWPRRPSVPLLQWRIVVGCMHTPRCCILKDAAGEELADWVHPFEAQSASDWWRFGCCHITGKFRVIILLMQRIKMYMLLVAWLPRPI